MLGVGMDAYRTSARSWSVRGRRRREIARADPKRSASRPRRAATCRTTRSRVRLDARFRAGACGELAARRSWCSGRATPRGTATGRSGCYAVDNDAERRNRSVFTVDDLAGGGRAHRSKRDPARARHVLRRRRRPSTPRAVFDALQEDGGRGARWVGIVAAATRLRAGGRRSAARRKLLELPAKRPGRTRRLRAALERLPGRSRTATISSSAGEGLGRRRAVAQVPSPRHRVGDHAQPAVPGRGGRAGRRAPAVGRARRRAERAGLLVHGPHAMHSTGSSTWIRGVASRACASSPGPPGCGKSAVARPDRLALHAGGARQIAERRAFRLTSSTPARVRRAPTSRSAA